MLKENNLIGALIVYRQEVRPFTDKQIALVRTSPHQAVIAIENARLLNELRQTEICRCSAADGHRRCAQSHQPLDLRSATPCLTRCESAARLCEADKVRILRQLAKNELQVAASYGYTQEYDEYMTRHHHLHRAAVRSSRPCGARRANPFKSRMFLTDPEYDLL